MRVLDIFLICFTFELIHVIISTCYDTESLLCDLEINESMHLDTFLASKK